MRRLLHLLAWTLLAWTLLALTLAAGPAGAHAEIRESDPPAGGVASTGTEELSMTFITMDPSEPVVVSVLDPDGNELTDGEVEIEETTALGTTVVVPVQPLDEGLHLVQWRALSSDGDGVTADTFEFTVEEPSAGSNFGVWFLWLLALGIPAAIFLRPGARRKR